MKPPGSHNDRRRRRLAQRPIPSALSLRTPRGVILPMALGAALALPAGSIEAVTAEPAPAVQGAFMDVPRPGPLHHPDLAGHWLVIERGPQQTSGLGGSNTVAHAGLAEGRGEAYGPFAAAVQVGADD